MDDGEWDWDALAADLLGDDDEALPHAAPSMSVGDWSSLAEELLGMEPHRAHSSGGMGDAEWARMAQEMLGPDDDEEHDAEVEELNLDSAPADEAAAEQPARKRGRPKGTFGSRFLRARLAEDAAQAQAAADAPAEDALVPGTTAYAREMKKRKRQLRAEGGGGDAARDSEPGNEPCPLPGMGASIWSTMRGFLLSDVQQGLVSAAAHSARTLFSQASRQLADGADMGLSRLFEAGRALKTQAQFAQECNMTMTKFPMLLQEAAAAAIESSKLLWGTFFNAVEQKLLSEDWKGILFVHRCRYDETPTLTRLRSTPSGTGLPSSADASLHSKVVQAEGSFHLLVGSSDGTQFLELCGRMPNALHVVDATTAECLKRVRCQVLGIENIPELHRVSQRFAWSLQQATVDRASSNLKAERALLHDCLQAQMNRSDGGGGDQLISKLTLPCDIHRIHQAHAASFALANDDISGILSTSLSQCGAGSLQTWRDILSSVLEQRLVIYHDDPPGGAARAYREAIYDLYLPVKEEAPPGPLGARTPHEVRSGRVLRLKQRHILAHTLNGYLASSEVAHFCSYGCCGSREHTLEKFRKFVTFALVPSKLKRFAKSRWQGQFAAAAYTGLLASHHGLLTHVVLAFTGAPVPPVRNVEDTAEEPDNAAFVQCRGDGRGRGRRGSLLWSG